MDYPEERKQYIDGIACQNIFHIKKPEKPGNVFSDHFNYYIKTPIILSEYNKIILFPTASPESNKCIWLSYNNIERYVEAEKNYTEIYFKGGKVLKIRAPYTTIDNQITKCIKIEKLLNSLQYTEM